MTEAVTRQTPETRTDQAHTAPTDVAPRATLELCDSAELQLGFSLPTFLRELYVKVGNGGFGPGYGL